MIIARALQLLNLEKLNSVSSASHCKFNSKKIPGEQIFNYFKKEVMHSLSDILEFTISQY